MRFQTLALLLPLCLAAPALAAETAPEPPALRLDLADGSLPPLAQRLPAEPRRDLPAREGWKSGRYGGSLTLLAPDARDASALLRLGYARLLTWDEDGALVPDILAGIEVEEDRVFTLTLRAGHRWSDGQPFTTEDFRFWWEDVATNAELSPQGPPPALLVAGQPPQVEILDAIRLRFTWPAPNARFLPALAAVDPLFIYRPAHYLKRFHPRYADIEKLQYDATAIGLASWSALYHRMDRPLAFDNPRLPTLQPWANTTAAPAERFVARRNPYFHRVDAEGRQLPYLDAVVLARAAPAEIAARAAAGEIGLQAEGLAFADTAALKQAAKEGRVTLQLWPLGRGAQLALFPNLNVTSPGWRDVLRDLRFRRALSLGIDRDEINKALYGGSAVPGADSLLPASPLFDEADRKAWAAYDPERAKALLDELGMTWKDTDGIRHLPDGRRAELVVETAAAGPAATALLELVKAQWAKIGIALVVRAEPAAVLRRRVADGATVMTLAPGLVDGLATAESSPAALAPTAAGQMNWPLWGLYAESGGTAGEPPTLLAARRLLALYQDWTRAADNEGRTAAWRQMLTLHADQVFSIGLLGAVPQPVAAAPRLRNLPAEARCLDGPGACFARYRPDTLWLAEK